MKLRLLLVFIVLTAFIAAVACSGSDGSSGRDGASPVVAKSSSDCLVCHDYGNGVHTRGVMDYDEYYASERDHSSCAVCHETTVNGQPDSVNFGNYSTGVTCIKCHWNSESRGSIHYDKATLSVDDCAKCHDSTATNMPAWHVSNGYVTDIVTNYKASPHANARRHESDNDPSKVNACALCHTSDGFSKYYKERQSAIGYYALFYGNSNEFIENVFNKIMGNSKVKVAGSGIGCNGCHDPHDITGLALKDSGTGAARQSAEFRTCTKCHSVLDVDNTRAGSSITTNPLDNTTYTGSVRNTRIYPERAGYHIYYRNPTNREITTGELFFNTGRSIMDTHFAGYIPSKVNTTDEGVTTFAVSDLQQINGYAINPMNKKACTECHDPHKASVFGTTDTGFADMTTVGDWSTRKNQAIITLSNSFQKSIHVSRAANHAGNTCFYCHVNEGFYSFYIKGDSAAVAYEKSGSSLRIDSDEYKKCNICHNLKDIDNTTAKLGTLNTLNRSADGHFTFWEKGALAVGGAVNTADQLGFRQERDNVSAEVMGRNAICVPCHAGDRNGGHTARFAAVIEAGDASSPDNTTLSSMRMPTGTHDAAAGITYGAVLYGVPGNTYSWVDEPHKDAACIDCHGGLGYKWTSAAGGTGGTGAGSDASYNSYHSAGMPVSKRTMVDSTYLTVPDNTNCNGCHSGANTAELTAYNKLKSGYKAAVEEIIGLLNTKLGGTDFEMAANGFTIANAASTPTSDIADPLDWMTIAGDLTKARNLYGLVANIQVIGARQGNYYHNLKLVKQILWDLRVELDIVYGGEFQNADAQAFVGTQRPQ